MPSPAGLMRKIHSMLKPGGLLVLSTPNRKRLFEYNPGDTDYPPNHQTRWSAEVFKAFIERNGFQVQEFRKKTIDAKELSRRPLEDRGFKIAARLKESAGSNQSSPLVHVANGLATMKKYGVRAVMVPAAFACRLIGGEGFGLYCVAKKK